MHHFSLQYIAQGYGVGAGALEKRNLVAKLYVTESFWRRRACLSRPRGVRARLDQIQARRMNMVPGRMILAGIINFQLHSLVGFLMIYRAFSGV
jgi:hypothetical protein